MMYDLILMAVLPPNAMRMCEINFFGQVLCQCDTPIQSLTFQLAGKEGQMLSVTLGPDDLLQQVGKGQFADGSTVQMCRVALQQGSPNMPFWILGDVFLRKVYAVHDLRDQQVVLFVQPDAVNMSRSSSGSSSSYGMSRSSS